MKVEVRWHDGYKKSYSVKDTEEHPRIGPDWLWIDRGPEFKLRFVHIPVRGVRVVRTDERL
ncbi:MAG: hypothetical protein WC248_02755 [Candidatus Methanomethylophilaceae archaeon]|jgi:hypothetical protein